VKRIISLFLLLFFLVAMVPSLGFCAEDKKEKATSGAATAGTAAGKETSTGISTGTIVIGAIIAAAIAAVVIGAGSSSSTSNH
jgi:hypothetical protein